jgi:Na+-driven multidrug efflux pump
LVWNFNLVFLATSRPKHILLTLIGMLLVLSIVGFIFTPGLGSRGVYIALDFSYFIAFAAQATWFFRSIHQNRQL